MSSYVELRCRTHYSFLRGASSPAELIRRASALGLPALAVTDRDGVYGIPRAFEAVRELQSAAGPAAVTRLITGAELTIELSPVRKTRLTLLAMSRAGYGRLCRLITASHMKGGEDLVSQAPHGAVAMPKKNNPGLGWHHFTGMPAEDLVALVDETVLDGQGGGDSDFPAEYLGALKDKFGDRLYLPLSRVMDGHDARRTRAALKLSARFGIPIVASNDVHFHVRERRELQDVLTCTREGVRIDEAGFRLFSNAERYLKSYDEMARLYADLPEALSRTLEVAERLKFCPSELRYHYPSEWIPPGETAQSYLERLTWEGALRRYGVDSRESVPEDVRAQLAHELRLIEELRFADYFLTVWEIVDFARGRGILCQGRGSAANSIVCYCLHITAIDPVRMKLLFERFISAERGEPPDIDVDFEHERREEVIQHIYAKYGRDRAAMVAACITYRSRSVTRDLGKVLGLTPEAAQAHPLYEQFKGTPRHLSIHSGGFTLSAEPIIETVPVEPARMEGRTIVQWDKEDLAIIGLLKIDVLALGMLTAIRKTFDLVRETESLSDEEALSLANIPADDPATYAMIQEADTVGVFQIESRAQMSMLGRLQPCNFYDLVIEVAIVRPGPIVGQMVHPYLKRRRGEEPIDMPHPALVPILERTLGVPLFQEQVMKMAVALAGFTPGEADHLRRAIGAWRSSGQIEKLGRKLQAGLLAAGLPAEFVDRVFKQIQGFAEYGFPESHAASFALLAYVSSYLKRHYPAQFTCALLNSQPMGFYSSHSLVEDARRHGVEIRPLEPNVSRWDCGVERSPSTGALRERANGPGRGDSPALRIGWRVVHGIARREVDALIEERTERGPFRGLGDFLWRTRLRPEPLFRLAMGEAFAAWGYTQRDALWKVFEHLAEREGDANANAGSGAARDQLSLFSVADPAAESRARVQLFAGLSDWEAIQEDFKTYGLSHRGHPMGPLRARLLEADPSRNSFARTTTRMAKRMTPNRSIRLAGLVIVRQRPPTAKGTAFATLEDEDGFMDMILHKGVQERYEDLFLHSPFLIVTGMLQRDRMTSNLIVKRLERLDLGKALSEKELRVQGVNFR